MRGIRFFVAALVAPLVPGLLVAIPDAIAGNLGMASWYVEFSAIAGYLSLIVVGLPLFWWLGKKKQLGFAHYVLIGLLCGMAAYVGAFIPGLAEDPTAAGAAIVNTAVFLPLAGLCGAIGGAAFWLIAPRGRPPSPVR